MDKNNDVLEQVESLIAGVEGKELFLRQLVIRNTRNLFAFISQIKLSQDTGYYFGVHHSEYCDLIPDANDFAVKCEQYQYGETESGLDFYTSLREFLEEEIESEEVDEWD